MRIVIALGGNALLRRGEPLTSENQRRNVEVACRSVAEVAEGHDVVVTHGNGPQVGMLALQAAASGDGDWPLDVLDAESEGMIGYMIEQQLMELLPGRRIATLLTQVEVDPQDPAFANPVKPVGPVYETAEAERVRAERGWHMAREGDAWRRVVASPRPLRILEISTIRHLLAEGIIVVCAGGGGIPVTVGPTGGVRGVEAVVDKDRTAALLGRDIGADALLLLTDVNAVYEGWPDDERRPVGATTPDRLSALPLDPGSMGPKVEAACRFVRETGGFAGIGRLEDAGAILAGRAGTRMGPVGG